MKLAKLGLEDASVGGFHNLPLLSTKRLKVLWFCCVTSDFNHLPKRFYHATHGFQGPARPARPETMLSVRGELSDRGRLSLAHTLRARSHWIPWYPLPNWKLQPWELGEVCPQERILGWDIEILIEPVPMKAIHRQVLSTRQPPCTVKQLHSSLRDSLPIGRRQSSYLKSSSCRCQSRICGAGPWMSCNPTALLHSFGHACCCSCSVYLKSHNPTVSDYVVPMRPCSLV